MSVKPLVDSTSTHDKATRRMALAFNGGRKQQNCVSQLKAKLFPLRTLKFPEKRRL